MALNIKSPETDKLARELAALTGASITEAVTEALRERLRHCRQRMDRPRRLARAAAIDAIFERASQIPVKDNRPIDELLGYNKDGTFE